MVNMGMYVSNLAKSGCFCSKSRNLVQERRMRKAAMCLDPSQSIRLKSRYHELMILEVYKPGWNKEEKQSQKHDCKVSAVGQGDVLALQNPHLLQLL